MELTGKIIKVLESKSGTSQKGTEWKKDSYVMEYGDGQYPRHCVFDVMNGKVDKLLEGETCKVYLDIDAREYQGRWYNSITAWKADRAETPQQNDGIFPPMDEEVPF